MSGPPEERARGGLIGPGRLVLVVGPSGAGKDKVLALARAATRGDDTLVFPRRLITRAADDSEDHQPLSDAAFERGIAAGAFALWWDAHGNRYAIPVAADDAIRAGHTVICNVSRTVVPAARRRYASVVAVLVTAPADVLKQRLAARGRASDGDLAQRLARSDQADCRIEPDVVIVNVGAPEIAARELVHVVAPGREGGLRSCS